MALYYISAAGLSGNSGASDALATTLTKALSIINPGDILLCKKGDTLSGTWTINRSGSSGSPIIIDSYGSSAHNPILDAGASTNAVITISSSIGYFIFNNLTFQNSASGNGIILLQSSSHDFSFKNCYVNNGIRGIDAFGCGSAGVCNLIVDGCYFTGITDIDDGTGRFKYGGGNHIQLNNCNGSGVEIKNNKCYTPITIGSSTTPFVGDIISIFQCNGTSGSNILVHHNNIRGGGSSTPASPGGGGKAAIVLGDVGGSYQYAHDNVVVNGGASQMLVQGGTFNNMSNNIMFAAVQPYTVVGFAYGNYSGAPANNNTMGGNVINTKHFSGSQSNLYIDQATGSANSTATGVSGGPTLALPANWATNTANTAVDPSASNALLSDPLWVGTPWDITVIPVISYISLINSFITGIGIAAVVVTASSYYPITSYSISPALPAGLSFNTSTGTITGTPTILSGNTTYTITANSIGGQGTTTIAIQVLAAGAIAYHRAIVFH